MKIIHGYYDVDEPEEAIGFTLDYVSENLAMLKNAYDAFGSVELENFFLSSLNASRARSWSRASAAWASACPSRSRTTSANS